MMVSRNINDWEVGKCRKLLGTLSYISLNDEDDRPKWTLTKNCSSTVKSWYRWLVMRVNDAVLFPHK